MLVMDPGRVRSIAAPWGHSNAIEPHVAWVISAVATLVVIAAVVVAEVWVAPAAAEVFREEEVDFEEVAVADGDVGRFRSGGDFPTREPRSRLGRCHARAHDTQEAAAAHSLRNLCVLCVSAVIRISFTAETQRTQRLRREIIVPGVLTSL